MTARSLSPARPRRWRVLGAFVLVALVSQLLWLNFAPLLIEVQRDYQVDETTASLLILVFPLLYCLLSTHSGRLIDRLGYKRVVGIGALVGAFGSLIRLDTAHFGSLLAGQIVIACAQPYVVNGISKLVADWFDPDEGAMATGLGTVGMFLGMAVGMATTPPLYTELGWRGAMLVNSVVAFAAAGAWFVFAAETGAAVAERPSPFRSLLRNRTLMLLTALGAAGLGFFNGLTTWLEQLVAPRGLDAAAAGLLGAAVIVGGIVGAIVIPPIADKLRLRKLPLLLCAIGAAAAYAAMAMAPGSQGLFISGALLGMTFMPAFALLLTMTGEAVAPRDNGAATALVMLAGNGGGVVVIVAMAVLDDWQGMAPWALLGGIVLVTVGVAAALPGDVRRTAG